MRPVRPKDSDIAGGTRAVRWGPGPPPANLRVGSCPSRALRRAAIARLGRRRAILRKFNRIRFAALVAPEPCHIPARPLSFPGGRRVRVSMPSARRYGRPAEGLGHRGRHKGTLDRSLRRGPRALGGAPGRPQQSSESDPAPAVRCAALRLPWSRAQVTVVLHCALRLRPGSSGRAPAARGPPPPRALQAAQTPTRLGSRRRWTRAGSAAAAPSCRQSSPVQVAAGRPGPGGRASQITSCCPREQSIGRTRRSATLADRLGR